MMLISILGRRGAGRSKVLESLIGCLKQKNALLRVGVIKHMAKEHYEIDQPGKDTYQYRMQGAETVMLAGQKRLAVFSNLTQEIPLEELLKSFQGFDLIFLEGYYREDLPKIEVYKEETGDRPLAASLNNVWAIFSDKPTGMDLPHFYDVDPLAAFIEERLCSKI
jgi:molybdopterin-guanine dinucleotide biosynthesis adapter protein